jgi:hypothetical protein
LSSGLSKDRIASKGIEKVTPIYFRRLYDLLYQCTRLARGGFLQKSES